MRTLSPVLAAVLACGCVAHVPLTGPGSRVDVVHVAPAAGCADLGRVSLASSGVHARHVGWGTAELEFDDETNRLRNLAGERGADTLLVATPQIVVVEDDAAVVVSGVAFRCAQPRRPASGAPVPPGAFLAVVRRPIRVYAAPSDSTEVRATLAAGQRVVALEAAINGYRRIRAEDGTPLGFVKDDALALPR